MTAARNGYLNFFHINIHIYIYILYIYIYTYIHIYTLPRDSVGSLHSVLFYQFAMCSNTIGAIQKC